VGVPVLALSALACGALLLLTAGPGHARDDARETLPQPLRLESALAHIDRSHPTLLRAQAARERSERELETVQALRDVRVDARLEARWIDPNELAPLPGNDDSRAQLFARKLVSDFGRTERAIAASREETEIARAEEELTQARHRLEVMRHFLDVALADLAFARDNEAMASAFVGLQRARDRNELGQVSDIDLYELEGRYQTARGARLRALQEQRRTRAELAEALNRPGQPPAQVLGPALPLELPPLPSLDEILTRIEEQSPEIAIRRAQLEVERHRTEAARALNRPRLSAELQFGAWEREFGGDRNPAAAGLVLEIPVYQGRQRSAAVGVATAERHIAEAELAQAMVETRSALRQLFFEIEALLVQRDEALARLDFRELYIDRARALYDMEEQADLGDSMVQQSAAAHFEAETEYALALAFERLALLVGDPSLSVFPPDP
jgi:outer membrane protein TolC